MLIQQITFFYNTGRELNTRYMAKLHRLTICEIIYRNDYLTENLLKVRISPPIPSPLTFITQAHEKC